MKPIMLSSIDDEDEGSTQALPEIYLFQSGSDLTLFGVTLKPSGSNLPAICGPWHRTGSPTSMLDRLKQKLTLIEGSDPILKALWNTGFFLAKSECAITGTVH
jgi:hypothetical protein